MKSLFTGSPTQQPRRHSWTEKIRQAPSSPPTFPYPRRSPSSPARSTRHPAAGLSRVTTTCTTTPGSTRAGTSPPGRSPSSSAPRSAPPSGPYDDPARRGSSTLLGVLFPLVRLLAAQNRYGPAHSPVGRPRRTAARLAAPASPTVAIRSCTRRRLAAQTSKATDAGALPFRSCEC